MPNVPFSSRIKAARSTRRNSGVHIFHWRAGVHDKTRLLHHWAFGFVAGTYLLGAAWSLLMLLYDRNYRFLLFAFYASLVGAILLLVAYRATDRPGFRALLSPKIWAIFMILSAAVVFESLTNGYDRTAAISATIGTFGVLAPLAVKALDDLLVDRLRRRAAERQTADNYPTSD